MMNEFLIEETNIKLEFFINIMISTLIIGKIPLTKITILKQYHKKLS